MKSSTRLDSVVFQLTPTRTRFEMLALELVFIYDFVEFGIVCL